MLKSSWEESIPKGYDELHAHEFTSGESSAERKVWLKEQLENAEAAGIEVFCRETEDGYVFAFKQFEHAAAFYLNAYGDPQTDRGQIMHHQFPGEEVDPHWIRAAEMYLQHMGIKYDVKQDGNVVSFSFDRFSEQASLRMMADGGNIDHMARALERSDGFLAQMRRILGGSEPSPDDHIPDFLP